MMLSKNTAAVLLDMVENRLAMIQISDHDELREVMTLQRCLAELQGVMGEASAPAEGAPRGRRRKLSAMIDELATTLPARQQA